MPGGSYPPSENSKTISVLALVFGGLSLLFGLIPIAGIFIGGLFGIAAIVLGIIGIFKSHRLFAIIGIALAVVGLIVAVIITVAVGRSADEIIEDWPTDYGDSSGEDEGHGDAPQDQVVDGTDPTAPLPAGSEVTTGNWTVVVSEVVPDATEQVLAANEFNVPPAEGFQYFMFQVAATYQGEESSIAWTDLLFGVYVDSSVYSEPCGIIPGDLVGAPEVFAGGTASGSQCIAVPTAGLDTAAIGVQDFWGSGQRLFVAAS
ncbi:hypothetical protein GCM10010403_45740 [Glycomyces rutgersensis]|uniref:DUF4352 domain-containing protein n=1 Tax=Glycomyces rutgersensis TaxID=58115 RepID=A0ABN3G9B6_9ACTN